MAKQQENQPEKKEENHICGIIMPLAGSEAYPASHWAEVRAIIDEAACAAGFIPKMVSDENEIGVIHNRIVQNIFENPIVVCDVSSKNPNVMFELGMRLAFDRATIVIKDDITGYSFDTSPIEHVNYPRSLKYSDINSFKDKLAKKIKDTYEASLKPDYSTFLKHFVTYKRKLEEKEVDNVDFILNKLEAIDERLFSIEGKVTVKASSTAAATNLVALNERLSLNRKRELEKKIFGLAGEYIEKDKSVLSISASASENGFVNFAKSRVSPDSDIELLFIDEFAPRIFRHYRREYIAQRD